MFRQEEINTDSYYITHITGTVHVQSTGEESVFVLSRGNTHGSLLHNMDPYYITRIPVTYNTDPYYITRIPITYHGFLLHNTPHRYKMKTSKEVTIL